MTLLTPLRPKAVPQPPQFPTLPRGLASLDTLFEPTGRARAATTTRCPSCGQPLVHPTIADHTPQHAPWLCTEERLMFWHVELTSYARKKYRAAQRDWGASAAWLRKAVERERG